MPRRLASPRVGLAALTAASLSVSWGGLVAGCGGGGGGGGGLAATAAGATAAGATSAAVAVPASAVGPLHAKALAFEDLMQAQHVPNGQVQDVRLDPSGQPLARGGPSRCLWTGFYAAAEAQRYRATGDPRALAAMERALWTLHDLAQVTGLRGGIARGFDEPRFQQGPPGVGAYARFNVDPGKPSRDQYTGWFYGVGLAWESIQDPALRAALQDDARGVCDALMAGDLALALPWYGPQVTLFDLNPNSAGFHDVTPQSWAQVDDFPFNLIVQHVPYDPAIVAAIDQAQRHLPPIRTGEAVRALLLFTVAERITGDPRYGAYKRDLLFGPRAFADALAKYLTISDDLLLGRNLPIVRDALVRTFHAVGVAVQAWLQATGRWGLLAPLVPVVAQGLGAFLGGLALDLVEALHDPNNQAKLARLFGTLRTLASLFNLAGLGSAGQAVDRFLVTYGPNLNHAGLVDLARTIRSYLSVNLTIMPLGALAALEPDPAVRALYQQGLEVTCADIADEFNAMVNAVHAGHGLAAGPRDVPDLVSELGRYPTDLRLRRFDHTGAPGVVPSVWPDRFGRATTAAAPDVFHVDERAPDIFPWRGHPRQLVSGTDDPAHHVAPLGYLAPYWLARERGLIGPAD